MEEYNKEVEEATNDLRETITRYSAWNRAIDNKEILKRNTEEEKDELDKEFRSVVILPKIAKLKWLNSLKNLFENSGAEDIQNPENHENQPNQREKTQGAGIV
tara:strand:+ start:3630 stop:3938 length:309 start_codon:yes stop_codon:yes gene_type:complete